jgi:amino-acid N-acetyltransferase
VAVRAAHLGDLPVARQLMAPFVARRELLTRTEGEMWRLLPLSFLAEVDGRAMGFCALEIYSQKLSEIQCLSYEETERGPAIIAALLHACLERAREHRILELMAVVPPRLEANLIDNGFRVVLPGQKKAMFIRTGRQPASSDRPASKPLSGEVAIRPAKQGDASDVGQFLMPFVARGELLPRTEEELLTLLRHGFVAEARGKVVGFTALEIYSEKLAEVQCISVDEAYRGQGIGRRLVTLCVDRARELHIAETMAITAREEVLRACGFDDSLPGAKIALFVRNR